MESGRKRKNQGRKNSHEIVAFFILQSGLVCDVRTCHAKKASEITVPVFDSA